MIECRHWRADDSADLKPMILDLLNSAAGIGTKMQSTARNAQMLLELGMQFSRIGDPTLIALDGDEAVGMCLWGGLPNPLGLDMRTAVCAGLGTYVVPHRRMQGISAALRQRGIEIARARGYDSVEGVAYDEVGETSALAAGFIPCGTQVEYRL